MLQDQCDELLAGYCTGFPLMGSGVAVAKGHVATVVGHDVGIANDAAIQVARKIAQRFRAFADTFTLRHPFLWRSAGGNPGLR